MHRHRFLLVGSMRLRWEVSVSSSLVDSDSPSLSDDTTHSIQQQTQGASRKMRLKWQKELYSAYYTQKASASKEQESQVQYGITLFYSHNQQSHMTMTSGTNCSHVGYSDRWIIEHSLVPERRQTSWSPVKPPNFDKLFTITCECHRFQMQPGIFWGYNPCDRSSLLVISLLH